ncbi:MAG: hypothetical protein AB8H80_08070 [Planctomycetota bacterium]
MSRVHRAVVALILLAAAASPAWAQQSYVQRMNARFAKQSPRAGEMLPDTPKDSLGFYPDGSPFALQDTRGALTVLVTGCLT